MRHSSIVSAFDAIDDPDGSDGTVTWSDLATFPDNGIPIALLAGEEKIWREGEKWFVAEGLRRHAKAINPSVAAATKSLIDRAHDLGLEVNVWTVNDLPTIERLVEYGVDGIFCDCVEILASYAP